MSTIVKIHVAAREFGLGEEALRDVYERVTKKRSLRAMTQKEREAVLDDFKKRGFQVKSKSQFTRPKSKKAHVRKIFVEWRLCKEAGALKSGTREALRAFIQNQTEQQSARVDDPEFLTTEQAQKIIEALKAMRARHETQKGNQNDDPKKQSHN